MSKAIRSKAFIIWLLAAGVFFFEYFARVAPSVMVPDLMHAFHVNALSLGALSALFYYSYVGMQLPVGALVDRFGAHKLLCISAGLCATMCFVLWGECEVRCNKVLWTAIESARQQGPAESVLLHGPLWTRLCQKPLIQWLIVGLLAVSVFCLA